MYKLQQNSVQRLADGASIPFADGNRDYEEYKQWLAEGNAPLPEFTDAELLQQAKASKLQQIEDDYIASEEQTVKVSGVIYSGGTSSVEAIDSYVRLNRLAVNTNHSIWDANGVEHSLTDSEVDGVILAIGVQASTNKFTKKNRKVALAVATTIAEVEVI